MSIILLFLGVATVILDAAVVGTFGAYLGHWNISWFGYFAYVYPFLVLIPLFIFYRDQTLTERRLSLILGVMLLFLALLMAQSILVSPPHKGFVGQAVVELFVGTVGILGIWLCILGLFVLSMILMIDLSMSELIARLKPKRSPIQKEPTPLKPTNTIPTTTETIPLRSPYNTTKTYEKKASMDVPLADDEDEIPFITQEPKKSLIRLKPAQKVEEISVDEEPIIEEEPKKIITKLKPPKKVEVLTEMEENKKLLLEIDQGELDKPTDFKLPPLSFLADPPSKAVAINEGEIDQKIQDLLEKLRRFKIEGDVVCTYSGPVVTTFEFKPAPHVKVSRILTLQDDLAMALRAKTIRIQAPVPGKDVVGIEVPNQKIETIYLKEILESDIFKKSSSPLTIALGKDIVGNAFVTDLKKLPHLLVAGTTGSGKSVGINAMLLSLLYRNSPDTLRFLMIDPKMLEFSIYNDIPHLLTPVITKPKQAIVALANMVSEMERRYQMMSRSKTKNIENYNEKAKSLGVEPFPYIVIIIDELADLMMTSGKDVEFYIARLAQMARASGIHIIVATQRPSVDVVTGLIKANLPSRISFKVGQKIDSKVILDAMGADSLLGNGDMLFTPPGSSGLIRLHAPYTNEDEIDKVVEYLKKQRPVVYDESFLKEGEDGSFGGSGIKDESELDELFEDAKAIVLNERKSSISYIQRRLNIGYNRAATIVEQLEAMGILSAQNAKGLREIIV